MCPQKKSAIRIQILSLKNPSKHLKIPSPDSVDNFRLESLGKQEKTHSVRELLCNLCMYFSLSLSFLFLDYPASTGQGAGKSVTNLTGVLTSHIRPYMERTMNF